MTIIDKVVAQTRIQVLNLSWNGYLKDGRDTQYHMASKYEPSDFVPVPNALELAR
jgi:hypothetical protein